MNGASSSDKIPSGVQGVCPPGWHVPSDAEWQQLIDYVVSQGYHNEWNNPNPNGAGNALKSCRQVGSPQGGACNTSDHPRWDSHGTHYGTDAFSFSALPGSYRYPPESFSDIGSFGLWWSATEASATLAWSRDVSYYFGSVGRYDSSKAFGFSLRCVRD